MQGALTVSQLTAFLREILEANEYLWDLWVVGEVSNFSRPSSGHRYFSLKDAGGLMRCVLFRDDMPGAALRDGDRVLAHGRVSVYPQRGELQFVCDFVRPEGVGILAARYEELKKRLGAEGLFDPGRKRRVPRFPQRIGLVTSPTGAALHDVKNVLARRWPLASLVVSPALVQGDQAAPRIVGALRTLAAEPDIDVAIVARGGGSIEDLWAFNDERVARALYAFPVPVVSGVGHETDETIADLVADVRAPTPSAAAERATPDIREMTRAVQVLERSMGSAARAALWDDAARVQGLLTRIERSVPDPAARARDVEGLLRMLAAGLERRCAADRARFERGRARIAGLDPGATLARGFAIVQDAQTRRVVNSVRKAKPGHHVAVSVADGTFFADIG